MKTRMIRSLLGLLYSILYSWVTNATSIFVNAMPTVKLKIAIQANVLFRHQLRKIKVTKVFNIVFVLESIGNHVGYNPSVKQINYPRSIPCIVLTVGNHYDGSTFPV